MPTRVGRKGTSASRRQRHDCCPPACVVRVSGLHVAVLSRPIYRVGTAIMGDPEIDAMAALSVAFDPLDDEARRRVLRWAADRYGLGVQVHAPAAAAAAGQNSAPTERAGRASEAQEGNGDETPSEGTPSPGSPWEHFADLYNAAAPKSNAEKALVAGYWFQKVCAQPSFVSQQLNTELKNLGHKIDRINVALDSNINLKPALVLQLRKSGNTAQARKTYKLTVEGLKTVESMVTGGS